MCTKEGITGGSYVPANYMLAGTSAPLGSCRPSVAADCGTAGDTFCSNDSNYTQEICTCASSTGLDTCTTYGKCIPTPCTTCQRCLSTLQPYILKLTLLPANTTADTVASAFEAFCTNSAANFVTASDCHNVAVYINTTFRGYAGRRPGVLCSMLGQCKTDVLAAPAGSAGCNLTSGEVVGRLDSCTAEGVSGGTQLADIRTLPGW